MGREIALNKIRKGSLALIICGSIITGFMALILTACIISSLDDPEGMFAVCMVFGSMLILGICLLVWGIKRRKHPERVGILKKYPEILDLIDEVYANKVYEDDYIICSQNTLCVKETPTMIGEFKELVLMYIHQTKTNGITTEKSLVIRSVRGSSRDIRISVYGKKQDKIDEIAGTIGRICPYMRFGYTDDNLAYLTHMQALFDQAHGNK